ncbi:carbohydrate sulfotransferase 1-like [Glandiceps talaboti]
MTPPYVLQGSNLTNTALAKERDKTLHIIVLASKRTGSSFVGEILNQSPDVLYLFEPLLQYTFDVLNGEMEADLFESESIEMLNNLFKCEFENLPLLNKLLKKIWCSDSLALQKSGICSFPKVRTEEKDKSSKLTQVCREYRYRAFKTIRIYDIELLRSYAVDPSMNLKIIHLVRDPRGIMNSRRKLGQSTNHDYERKHVPWDETEDLCRDLTRNLHIVESFPTWLQDKYTLIRYEDTAKHPEEMAQHIYDFLGIPMPDEVRLWLKQNTHGSRGGSFSTTRNSDITATKWRKELPFQEVLQIQEKCQTAMKMLGYKSVKNKEDLEHEDRILGTMSVNFFRNFKS